MNRNGYQQYKEQSVNTMTKGEMLLLLYDELLKRLMRAELALDKEDFEGFKKAVTRCRDIVIYLQDCLDPQYSISSELRRMYDFFLYEFSRLEAGRRKDIIQEVRPLIMELRNAFQEADKLAQHQE